MTKPEYTEKIFEILESFHYPDLVVEFNEYQVAKCIAGTVNSSWREGLSPMMCSVLIWALTMSMQVIPLAARSVKH